MANKNILVIGSNMAGFSAAMELRSLLENGHQITVIVPQFNFIFTPSLVWVPFGKLKESEIQFDCIPFYKQYGIHYIKDFWTGITPEENKIHLSKIGRAHV